ncbi:MAG TPA: AAA family ATPase [Acidimicrobiia bacterium]|jgi:DNA repair protein RecN (Recombination protein N)|nr:AAA family ATPase [Acidimicrobiia bacterium]
MLDELMVQNLGLIEEARLEPGRGLVVVTGETGAGKTMLLGALRLLMGASGRKDLVGPAGGEATVQARFVLDGDEVLVARRLSRTGRSKAYLHGLMAPLKELEVGTSGVVELVAQHDHLRLTQAAEIRRLLDGELDDAGRRALAAYDEAWLTLQALQAQQAALGGDTRALERELEILRFQAREIESAGFAPGEDEVLDVRVRRLRNVQGILEALDTALAELGEDGLERALDRVVISLSRASNLDPTLQGLEAQAADLGSLAAELRSAVTAVASEMLVAPGELDEVENRLATLNDLRRKYGASLEDVFAFAAAAVERRDELEGLLAEADGLVSAIAVATQEVASAGRALTAARTAAGSRLTATALEHLVELGFSRPVLSVEFVETAPGAHGVDRPELRFASDDQLEPGPIGRIASGGELSRLVLAIRLATGAADAAVVAFDEVDAGVGGATALAMGRKLAKLADRRQVLCVTHLPQIAAQATTHYVVERDGSRATVREVVDEARIEELSRMLAGMPNSERGREHAAELLEAAAATRR